MLKNFSRLFLVSLAILLSACGSSPKKDVAKSVEPVIENNTTHAVPVLSELEKQSYLNAVELVKQEKLNEAEEAFKQLTAKHPNLAGAYVNLGLIELARKEKGKAQALFQRALQANPNNISALIQSSNLLQEQGKFLDAEKLLLRGYESNKLNPTINYNLGVLYELYLQDYDKAIDHYEIYVENSTNEDVKTVQRWIKLLERK